MWLIPATLDDAPLLFGWAQDQRKWLETVLPEAARWRSDIRRLKRSLSKLRRGLLIASEPSQSGVGPRRFVGVLIKDGESEIRWAVHPDYDPRTVAPKMVKLVFEPGLRARVNRNDLEARKVLAAAGFDPQSDGDRQLWRAERIPDCCGLGGATSTGDQPSVCSKSKVRLGSDEGASGAA